MGSSKINPPRNPRKTTGVPGQKGQTAGKSKTPRGLWLSDKERKRKERQKKIVEHRGKQFTMKD